MTNSIVRMTDKFEQLPDDAKKAIENFPYDKELKDIHNHYHLHIDQASALERIVAGVIFGEHPPMSMVSMIGRELRVPLETAQNIATDINTKLLRPIQKSMQLIQETDL